MEGHTVVVEKGATRELAEIVASASISEMPERVVERAKHLTLDGLGCAFVAAHLPWSEIAVNTVRDLEGPGACTVIGWESQIGPAAASLLNATFIQGFELDDYHPYGSLHTASIVLPAAIATAEHIGEQSGARLLEAIVLGLEVGPRAGMAMGGLKLISHGWHSGSVCGTLASAAAAARLRELDGEQTESAFGIAATQSSGLMSAQFDAMVKRMHHGFAARSGLYAAALAGSGFSGIRAVVERDYGGLVTAFMPGEPHDGHELTENWGSFWEIDRIAVKPYATMGGIHPSVDGALQLRVEEGFAIEDIERIEIRVALPHFRHAGWTLERPAEIIGAQMNLAYGVAVTLIDGAALVEQFLPTRINQDDVWELIEKTTVLHDPELDEAGLKRGGAGYFGSRVTITRRDGSIHVADIPCARGAEERALSNEEIREKFHELMRPVADPGTAAELERVVLNLENASLSELVEVLRTPTRPLF